MIRPDNYPAGARQTQSEQPRLPPRLESVASNYWNKASMGFEP
jgi:hypothetical protein